MGRQSAARKLRRLALVVAESSGAKNPSSHQLQAAASIATDARLGINSHRARGRFTDALVKAAYRVEPAVRS